MANEKELRLAKSAFDACCEALDKRGWVYDKDEEKLRIDVGVTGEDLPMDFIVRFDPEYQIIKLQSLLPFKMNEEKRVEGAIAINSINFSLADGSFDYDFGDGSIAFRLTSSFRGSLIDDDLLSYMIDISCHTIDEYNDRLLMLSKGKISWSDIVE